ncbi:MAG: hypothetical protein NTW11_02775 [Candidatus Staskawiczbacteria bacterium]|nr:hypothetical protein [Candidatus Staskawiczbacteria bacterium]
MKIAICGSMSFSKEMVEIKKRLEEKGHEVLLPHDTEKYVSGELAFESGGESTMRKIAGNLIQEYFLEIKNNDAVVVANYDKNGIKNYVGGNSFLEAGFAHVLGKKLYFINDIPNMPYADEIKAMQPIILNGDLGKIN